jgi:carbamoyltransferase
LADPRIPGLKNFLNKSIKGREDFRPYGCSCIIERAQDYFEINGLFESPFMSFAPKVKENRRGELTAVTHIDGTSRVQTLHKTQDPLFYELIENFGKKTGLYCLLNTSLNVMGEPLIETVEDAARFFASSPLKHMIIGDFLVTK